MSCRRKMDTKKATKSYRPSFWTKPLIIYSHGALRRCLICPSSALIHRKVFSRKSASSTNPSLSARTTIFGFAFCLSGRPSMRDQKLVVKHARSLRSTLDIDLGEWTVSGYSRWKNCFPTPSSNTIKDMRFGALAQNAKFSRKGSPEREQTRKNG